MNFTKPGMGIEDGVVGRWLKQVGDRVAKGEAIVEIETAKAIEEVEAPVRGVLASILLATGQTAPVNGTLCVIEEDHE